MSKEIVAGIISDTHIDDGNIWTRRPLITGDSYAAFREGMQVFYDRSVPAVIHAGDAVDKRVQKGTKAFSCVMTILNEWDSFGEGEFWFIQGQHGFMQAPEQPYFSICGWASHAHKQPFDLGPFKVYGLDFQHHGELQRELDAIPKGTDILIAHQTWSDWMGDHIKCQGAFSDIPVVNTVITGDLHQFVDYGCVGKDGQDLRAFSPGATHFRNIAEPVDHYVALLYDDSSIEKVQLTQTRKKFDIEISDEESLEKALEVIPEMIQEAEEHAEKLLPTNRSLDGDIGTPIIRVTYPHGLSYPLSKIRQVVDDRAHLFWKELPAADREAQVVLRDKDLAGDALTLDRCLPEVAKANDLTVEEARLSGRLLDADDPYEEGVRWLREEVFSDDTEGKIDSCSSSSLASKTL